MPLVRPYSFGHGVVFSNGSIVVAAAIDELEKHEIDHTLVLESNRGEWSHWIWNNRTVDLCAYEKGGLPMTLLVGIEGSVGFSRGGDFWAERVGSGQEAPSNLRRLTAAKVIGSYIYVVGMARQVFRWHLEGKEWEKFDQGCAVPPISTEISGFLSIDGFDSQEIYAGGFFGELWVNNGCVWHKIDSPTNLKIECIECVEGEAVYAAGSSGLILKGRGASWEVIRQDLTKETFWSMGYFQGVVYLATEQGRIFSLVDDELLEVNFGAEKFTTRRLVSSEKVLLSIGVKDIVTFDGNEWLTLDPGEIPFRRNA